MVGDIIEFLKTAKSCVDTIIEELKELEKLESHGLKKIDLFTEIINALGSSVVNLEKAYMDNIPLEHKLKYLIVKELKFDLEEFAESLSEYNKWYKAVHTIKNISQTSKCSNIKKFWFYCGCGTDISNVSNPNIFDGIAVLASISPSTMNKQLDESFHKIMGKLIILIELEKDIFGTAINIIHPVLRRAWMSLGPADKCENEVEQHKIEEALLAMLKEENGGIVVNEKKCRELISDFLEGLEKKAGNIPNGRISIKELNVCEWNESNQEDKFKSVLKLLGLESQPGCDNNDSDNNITNSSDFAISSKQILLLLAQNVAELLKNNKSSSSKDLIESVHTEELISIESKKLESNSTEPKQNINIPCSFENKVLVNPTDNSGLLKCEGYGSDWPYKIAFNFIIPKIDQKTYEHIEVKMECTDQGWGNTGQCNVRYQIGTGKIELAFFIDRTKTTHYTHLIKKNEIVPGDQVTFWLCCAPWSGWSATLKSVNIEAKLLN